MTKIDVKPIVAVLNRLLETELAGVVRYTHYSFLVFGFGRIPIVSWLRAQADESLMHAQQVGEWITSLGDHPSLAIGPLLESHQHDIGAILRESLEFEGQALELYRQLLRLVEGKLIPSGCPADPEAYGSSLVVERDDCVGAWHIRVGNSSLGLVGRLDASPDNANARSVYLAAGLRSSC